MLNIASIADSKLLTLTWVNLEALSDADTNLRAMATARIGRRRISTSGRAH